MLHLHAGLALENERGSRARLLLPGTAGFAHVSCLAEQAKILVAEAVENNLDDKPSWSRWHTCSLCEQEYHGVVKCALGWACWKAYVGAAGGGRGSGLCAMTSLGTAYPMQNTRGRVVRERGNVGYAAAPW